MMSLLFLLLAPLLISASETTAKKPHVLLLLVDDLGWTDISAHNAEYETKTIDSLISSGIELTNYHVHLVCSPTRSALMTGQFSFKLGLQRINTIGPGSTEHLPFDAPTIAELLKKSGYQTHMLGKWHLGYAAWNMTPTGRGFDSHYGYFQGAEDYYTREVAGGYDFWRNREVERNYTGDYSTMLYDNYMTQLLYDYNTSQSSDPLFVYMAFQTVHTPIEVSPKNYTQCEHVKGVHRRIYCNKIQYLDEVILHYTELFKQYGLWDDTLLVLSTDNGGMPYWSDDVNPLVVSWGCNMPYRAGKATLFQGGVKGVGFINGGDNLIESKLRGTSSDILTHTVDWLPTIVKGAAGVTLPENVAFDGISMWNTLMNPGKEGDIWSRDMLFLDVEKNGSFAALIDGDYKFIQGEQLYTGYFPCGETEIPRVEKVEEWLFNLKDDPYEKRNLAREQSDLVIKYKNMISNYVVSGNYVQEQDATTYPRSYPRYHDGVWEPWLN